MYPVPVEAATQGKTDQYIGTWLKDQKRDGIYLASKVCGRSDKVTWVRDGDATPIVDRANIMESVEKSLLRLGTDYIDLLQIHWWEHPRGECGSIAPRASYRSTQPCDPFAGRTATCRCSARRRMTLLTSTCIPGTYLVLSCVPLRLS
jgi:hypothetical protein